MGKFREQMNACMRWCIVPMRTITYAYKQSYIYIHIWYRGHIRTLIYLFYLLLSLIPGHTAVWYPMLFLSSSFMYWYMFFYLLFCSRVIGFLSCFSVRPKYLYPFPRPSLPHTR